MKLTVDISHRYSCMRSHTATHLLHAELIKIFPQTKQAGSYVGPDELRFDFFAQRGLTNEELIHITQTINKTITHTLPVSVMEMKYEEALKTGAKAFFEDTYPEIVRVVSIGSWISVELCGGTHVSETSQIGSFAIIEQTAVAAGVKRITALTGPKVATHLQDVQSHIESVAQKLNVPVKQLDAKIDKIITEAEEIKDNYSHVLAKYIRETKKSWSFKEIDLDYIIYLGDWTEKDITMPDWTFKDFFETCKQINELSISRIVYTKSWQYALFHPQAKEILLQLAIKGGGSSTLMQGRDDNIVKLLQ